jgi:hypothetical protein
VLNVRNSKRPRFARWRLLRARFPSGHPLTTNRQRELKDGALGRVCRSPQSSSVSFDNRTADRQPHAQALRLGRIEGVEKTIETLRIQPWARISHCGHCRTARIAELSSKGRVRRDSKRDYQLIEIFETAKLLELYATLIQNMPPPTETAVDWSNGAYVQITLFDEIAFDRYYPAFARHREHL